MFLKITVIVTLCCVLGGVSSADYEEQEAGTFGGGGVVENASSSEIYYESNNQKEDEASFDYLGEAENRTLAEVTTEESEAVAVDEEDDGNRIFKEGVQTTMVPEYVQNRRFNIMEAADNDGDGEITSMESNTNESYAHAMKTNILYTDENALQARSLDHNENNEFLDAFNRSAQEESEGQEDETLENLEKIGLSGLIGTTYSPLPITTTSAQPSSAGPIRLKKGKQIRVKKLLPHEQLRNYIEDAYIRMPLAVIVDPSPVSLERTKALWRDALRTNFAIKIVLIALNGPGIPTAYNFNNTRQFLAGLNSIKENTGGNAFVGVIHASDLVPYDSAVFISTASVPRETDLLQDAAITLLKKRIRLYLIWYGEKTINDNETPEATGGILGEVAIRSGGEILHVVGSHESQEIEGNSLTLVADAFHGTESIEIPVDTTLSSLHIKIDSAMKSATLETTNGEINLKKLVKFKSIFVDNSDTRLDAFVPLYKVMKSTTFYLNLIPENVNNDYNVYVRADRRPDTFLGQMLQKLDSGYLIRDGRRFSPSHENLRFPDDPDKDAEIITTTERKNNSSKASQQQPNLLQTTTQIEIGIQSQLLLAPGMQGQIYFELTNLRSEPVWHTILVVDERKFLRTLSTQNVLIPSRQSVVVTLAVLIPQNSPQGTRDKITFTCQGNEQSSKTVELRVVSSLDTQDTTPPKMNWRFGNRCDSVTYNSASCSDRIWNLEITAQDWETGVKRIESTPSGLVTSNSYIAGSNEPARATYYASCCQPKVTLTAYDLAGNQRTYTIDVRDLVLSEASIAAIVLGALLLILLIVLVIILIVWCVRRKRASHELPTYRTRSERLASRS